MTRWKADVKKYRQVEKQKIKKVAALNIYNNIFIDVYISIYDI